MFDPILTMLDREFVVDEDEVLDELAKARGRRVLDRLFIAVEGAGSVGAARQLGLLDDFTDAEVEMIRDMIPVSRGGNNRYTITLLSWEERVEQTLANRGEDYFERLGKLFDAMAEPTPDPELLTKMLGDLAASREARMKPTASEEG